MAGWLIVHRADNKSTIPKDRYDTTTKHQAHAPLFFDIHQADGASADDVLQKSDSTRVRRGCNFCLE